MKNLQKFLAWTVIGALCLGMVWAVGVALLDEQDIKKEQENEKL